jgi:hypothetical protein
MSSSFAAQHDCQRGSMRELIYQARMLEAIGERIGS